MSPQRRQAAIVFAVVPEGRVRRGLSARQGRAGGHTKTPALSYLNRLSAHCCFLAQICHNLFCGIIELCAWLFGGEPRGRPLEECQGLLALVWVLQVPVLRGEWRTHHFIIN